MKTVEICKAPVPAPVKMERSLQRDRITYVPWDNMENMFGVVGSMALYAATEISRLEGPPQRDTFVDGRGSLVHRLKYAAECLALHAVTNNAAISTRPLSIAKHELRKLVDFAGGIHFDDSPMMLETTETCRALTYVVRDVEDLRSRTQLILPRMGLISEPVFWRVMHPWQWRDQHPNDKLVSAFDCAIEAGHLHAAMELFEGAQHDSPR